MEGVKLRWEQLQRQLDLQRQAHEEISAEFTNFLTSFTSFCNWLCEIYSRLLDELCNAIPTGASEDTIAVHRNTLQVRNLLLPP